MGVVGLLEAVARQGRKHVQQLPDLALPLPSGLELVHPLLTLALTFGWCGGTLEGPLGRFLGYQRLPASSKANVA